MNLRYYLLADTGGIASRGVGFVSEMVPRFLIAAIANTLYNEHYRATRMKRHITLQPDGIHVGYFWKNRDKWESLSVTAENDLKDIAPGSAEEFILEHYYGYNALRNNTTISYKVEHPRWQVYPVRSWALDADITTLYGKEFAPYIQGVQPHSVFLARGSDIVVRRPVSRRTP